MQEIMNSPSHRASIIKDIEMETNPIRRSSSVLSNNGRGRRKWTINTQELNSTIMDEERQKFKIYEYLCHVGEAKEWMERLLKKELAPISEFETQLQYGITLAELARLFSEESVKKIFESTRLQFRHSDNINYFFDALRKIKFPEIFFFETTDCYERKNMPKVIYCLHALSHYLELRGYGRAVRDLVGKLEFTDHEIQTQMENLKENNINLPTFNNLENKLQEELKKSTISLNIDFDKKNDDDSSMLDDFVPSQSFYRSSSKESLLQKDNKPKDNVSLHKELFRNQSRDRMNSVNSIIEENQNEKPVELEKVEEKVEEQPVEPEKVEEKVEEQPVEPEKVEEKVEEQPVEPEKIEEKVEEQPVESEKVEEKVEEQPVEPEKVEEKVEEQPVEPEKVEEKVEEQPVEPEKVEEKVEEKPIEPEKVEEKPVEPELREREVSINKEEVSETTSLLNEDKNNEEKTAEENSTQTKTINDNGLMSIFKDSTNWLIIVLIISFIHALASKNDK
ncbi:hypothetical protein BCR32DRAFT_269905 [Anaeromyces robustus]|uniref:Calponin-homology (CH) domain-containing protein n=1 Tax=Anaeromyces robustus TaxID=1754192 RepID=A0A1Y1WZD7_9FUNG|nr:hypothetical protein BCR32DRAFT_269905 [Anaeromyces robustus]|eukprot:ORX78755.1 hypothetical protein BCR32DRAFT_269905 [Anaeromyces robustus]